jgi:hypothetical protein
MHILLIWAVILLFCLCSNRAQIDMPRRKQVMKFVDNVKKRELTYKNRLRSLVKKISQLAALCSVDILLVGIKPGTASVGGERGITVWPADHGVLKELATRFGEMPPERVKESLDIGTYLQGELGKEQRKLVKVKQCRLDDVLTLWDRNLDDLSVDDLIAIHHAMDNTLERARRQMAELIGGGVDAVATSAVSMVTAPALQHAPSAFPGNAFDLNLSDAGSSIGPQDHYYLPPDILPPPFPVQSPYIGFQFHMQPPCNPFGGAPMPCIAFGGQSMPFPMVAPLGFSFPGGGINVTDRQPATTSGVYDDFAMQGPGQGFPAGGGMHQEFQSAGTAMAYHQDFLSYSLDAAGTNAGAYGLDSAGTGAAAYQLGTPNNPMGTATYQLQNDTMLWPDNGHALGEQEEQSRLPRFDRWM